MAVKTVKNVIGMFSLVIIAGLFVTLVTKSVIAQKREELYDFQTGRDDITATTTDHSTEEPASTQQNGPMANIITKEKYLEAIKTVEQNMSEAWASITAENMSDAIKLVKFEKNYWEGQLSEIRKLYYEIQPIENTDALQQEESDFSVEREKLAKDAAKAAGEAYDGLQYNKEYVRVTKEKTYELIERYFAEE